MDTSAAYATFQQLQTVYQGIDTANFQLLEEHKQLSERVLPIRKRQERLYNEGLRDWVLLSLLYSYTPEELLISVLEFSSAFDLNYSGDIQQKELIRGLE